MEDQVKLMKELKKVAAFNSYTITDLRKWLGLSNSQYYRASVGELKLEHEILDKMKEIIELFEETGRFELFDRPRQKIDYDLLHEIDKDYTNHTGSWNKEAYDDPRLKYVLYYEDVE